MDGSYEQALNSLPADIRAEVDALVPPKGCNSALFIALKKSFVQAIASSFARGAKAVCTPPTGDNNKAAGLTVENVSGDYILSWNYRNIGDYDQGGTVSVADITPIAMHFGHTVGTDPLDTVIDGDGSGTVGISDITPLARNFGVNVASYRVEESVTETGEYTLMGAVSLNSGSDADQGWMRLEYTLPDRDARWLRVVPLDGQGNPGVPSDAMEFGGSGTAPVIESVSPLSGATNAAVQFSAVVSGVGPFTYVWNFNGAATPDSSTDAQPNVTLSATSGDYDCSVEVTNAAGPTLFNFTVTVGAPPNATAVNPTGGVTGEDVQFAVTVTGDAPLSYAWDFGGGATPATSTEESPIVTLGAAGVYDTASVTVTNPFGESFFGFDLAITAAVMPAEIIMVTPTSGVETTEISISASVFGTPPFTYSWDFDAAATPGTSTEAVPLITLNGPGTYPCSLTVENLYGSDTYDFNFEVLPVGAYDEIEPNNPLPDYFNVLPPFPVDDWYCRLSNTDDVDDYFSFTVAEPSLLQVTMNLASDDPDLDVEVLDEAFTVLGGSYGSSDIESFSRLLFTPGTYYIHCFAVGYTLNEAGDYWLDLALSPASFDEVEDNDAANEDANDITLPLSGFSGHCGGPIGYDGDSDDYFEFNAAEGDSIYLTMSGIDDSYDLDLYLLDSEGDTLASSDASGPNEALSHLFTSADLAPYYINVTAYLGSGTYELNTSQPWDAYVIDDTTGSNLGNWSVLTYTGGHPGCFYLDYDNYNVYFAYSDTAEGTGTWTVYPVDTSGSVGEWMSGGSIGGCPVAVYTDSSAGVKFAICETQDGSGTWNISDVDVNGEYDPSVTVINGYPAVAYEGSGESLMYAMNDAADGTGTWTPYEVDSGSGAYYTSIVELPNGYPGVFYNAYNSDEVRFATCDAFDGSGTWSFSSALWSDTYPSTSCAIVDGRPAVACIDTNESPYFVINSLADGSGTWHEYEIADFDTNWSYLSLAVLDGVPSVIFHDDYAGGIYFAQSALATGEGGWHYSPILSDEHVGSNHSLGWVNGKPACVFYQYTDHYVGFATPSGF